MSPNMKTVSAVLLSAVFSLVSLCSMAREITGISIASDMSAATVSFTEGETGDGHTLYFAYGASDCGDTLYDWANGGGCVAHGTVADNATSASVALPAAAQTAACFRAFLVKTLETPAYKTNTSKLIDCIREDNGTAWFSTGYLCTGNERITAVFENAKTSVTSGFRPFGVRSSDFNSVYEVYNSKKSNIVINASIPMDRPLCIFGTCNSSDGSTIEGKYAPVDALLYRFTILTNNAAYARYYIPAISTANNEKGCLWDAVENTIVESSRQNTFLRSFFLTKDASGSEYQELDFHKEVPAELQTKYERVDAALTVGRQITELSVARSADTGLITAEVSLTCGAEGDEDVLYIAWGDGDKGGTLADWGENWYCAGEVACDATSATVTLPAGKYPHAFRAFLVKPALLDCDSFAEYLMVKDDGMSYIKTDYLPRPADKYAISFALAANNKDQRIISGGNVTYASDDNTGTVTEVYTGEANSKSSLRVLSRFRG